VLRPVPLSLDPNDPNSKEQLSQVDALRALIGRRNRQNDQSMSTLPKDLSILAAVNVAVFFIYGIITPSNSQAI
jgi:hypothetical protein